MPGPLEPELQLKSSSKYSDRQESENSKLWHEPRKLRQKPPPLKKMAMEAQQTVNTPITKASTRVKTPKRYQL